MNVEQNMKQETITEAVKAAPAIAGTVYSAITLNELVALATLIYIIIQAAILVHKHYIFLQDRKKK